MPPHTGRPQLRHCLHTAGLCACAHGGREERGVREKRGGEGGEREEGRRGAGRKERGEGDKESDV